MLKGINLGIYTNIDRDYYKKLIELCVDLKIDIIQLGICWHDVEKTQGEYNWDATDFLVNTIKDAGIEILANIGTFPCWANGVGEKEKELLRFLNMPNFDGLVGLKEEYLDDFTNFIDAVMERYNFRYIQLLNEPFSMGWVDIVGDKLRYGECRDIYAKMLRKAYVVIKEKNKDNVVLSGSLDYAGHQVEWMFDDNRDWFDMFSLHVYPRKEGEIVNIELIEEASKYEKDICITEYAYFVGEGHWLKSCSEEEQRDSIEKAFNYFKENDKIKIAMYHTLNDFSGEFPEGVGVGLVKADGSKRLSYELYKGLK